jgi:hypothetical protein
MPEPDVDEALLLAAVRDAGCDAEVVAWDDPHADWHDYDVVVLRSTWNYAEPGQTERFLAWALAQGERGALRNCASIVRWNAHKSYLHELAAAGVAVVPTTCVERSTDISFAEAVSATDRSAGLVEKPAVSAGSRDTHRVAGDAAAIARFEATWRPLLAREDMLVQPYVPSVDGHGERCLTYLEGGFSHAVRKNPRFVGDAERVSAEALAASPEEMRLAQEALDAARNLVPDAEWPLLYARVDMAPGADGAPMLMELELIEPSLFLSQHPPSLATFADAIAARVGIAPA